MGKSRLSKYERHSNKSWGRIAIIINDFTIATKNRGWHAPSPVPSCTIECVSMECKPKI